MEWKAKRILYGKIKTIAPIEHNETPSKNTGDAYITENMCLGIVVNN